MHMAKPFTAIRLYDPAIDRSRIDAEGIQRYARSRDESLLPIIPGSVPVRFHLRRISRRMWDWVEQATSDADRQTRAFRAAVLRVEGLPVDGGGRIDWAPAVTKEASGLGLDVAMTELELERFSYADVYEIGDVAWVQSFFPRDCVATYRLLPSSALVWDQTRALPSVGTHPSDAVPSSVEHRAPQDPPVAPPGDAPTAATAPVTAS